MRIMTWNIRASMTDRIVSALTADRTIDLLVLPEYRIPKAGDRVATALAAAGWTHSMLAAIPTGLKGVAVYSREPLEPAPQLIDDWAPEGQSLAQWIVAASVPGEELAVLAAYVPYRDGPLKEAVWNALTSAATSSQARRLIIAGDFNSCYPHESDTATGYTVHALHRMTRTATDLWRHRVKDSCEGDHITWAGPDGKGNRLDFVFGTPPVLAALISAEHRHDLRTSGASDHSGVVVELGHCQPVSRA
jgi:exonuclease III